MTTRARPKIRVLIADDSPVVRQVLTAIIDEHPEMEVVGAVASGDRAVTETLRLEPDLITMDVTMPGIDGVEAARRIMSAHPTPIVIVTASDVGPTSMTAFRALAAGAVEVLPKPDGEMLRTSIGYRRRFLRRLIEVAEIGTRSESFKRGATPRRQTPAPTPLPEPGGRRSARLIAVGASTGGPQCLKTVLGSLDPADSTPPVLVVQHMSQEFMASFVTWLASVITLPVKLAEHAEKVQPATVYVAPGSAHMRIDAGLRVRISHEGPHQHQRPSVDVCFESLADHVGRDAVAALLTGMGRDGAEGLLKIRQSGGQTLAQDEMSSIVYGMPRAALELGAVSFGTSPASIARHLASLRLSGAEARASAATPVSPQEGSEQ